MKTQTVENADEKWEDFLQNTSKNAMAEIVYELASSLNSWGNVSAETMVVVDEVLACKKSLQERQII